MEKLYTTQEIKDLLGIGRSTVNKFALIANLGRLMGNSRVFNEADLQKMKEMQAAGAIREKAGRPGKLPPAQPNQG